MRVRLRSSLWFTGVCLAATAESCSVADVTGVKPTTWPAVWVSATWSGGRTGTPLSSRGVDPNTHTGSLCPAKVLTLENHPNEYSYYPFGTEFVGTNSCTIAIEIAYCRTAGNGGGNADVPVCSIDPRQTPEGNLKFARILSGTDHHLLALTTPVDFDIQVFWCSDDSSFNLGAVKGVAPTDCVQQ
jgi:hypothetical protein